MAWSKPMRSQQTSERRKIKICICMMLCAVLLPHDVLIWMTARIPRCTGVPFKVASDLYCQRLALWHSCIRHNNSFGFEIGFWNQVKAYSMKVFSRLRSFPLMHRATCLFEKRDWECTKPLWKHWENGKVFISHSLHNSTHLCYCSKVAQMKQREGTLGFARNNRAIRQ